MVVKGIIKSGEYFDSVSLMIVSGKMRAEKNVLDSSIVMGTAENRAILKTAGLFTEEFNNAKDSDLLLVVSAKGEGDATCALEKADGFLKELKNKNSKSSSFRAKSIAGALEILPGANLALISVAGAFATNEAMNALNHNMNVMLFSDNISVSDEKKLKEYADKKELIVMGPDCGTAIIQGAPLAFANAVTKGNIGIVAASGTGAQEVSSLISNYGLGVSHVIGTGGRDIKEDIGGLSFLRAISMLNEDDATKVIVLISKPPHESVLEKIGAKLKKIDKPVVSIFLGADKKSLSNYNMKVATTLEEAALFACEYASNKSVESSELLSDDKLGEVASRLKKSMNSSGKMIRALYSGGTFCSETQLILKDDKIDNLYSNAPAKGVSKLKDSLRSEGHTILDLGEDEFTVGRPHPMIDYTLRNRRILEEIQNIEVALLILDLVIGYGSNMNPLEEFVPTVKEAKKLSPNTPIICFVTGTSSDPQNKKALEEALRHCGAEVVYSNAQAAKLASKLVQKDAR